MALPKMSMLKKLLTLFQYPGVNIEYAPSGDYLVYHKTYRGVFYEVERVRIRKPSTGKSGT